MSKLESKLTRVEAGLRAMIEGDSAKGGIPRKLHNRLFRALVQAMQAGVDQKPSGDDLEAQVFDVPDQYTIVMPPDQAHDLLNHPAELDRLAKKLEGSAAQANLRFTASPILHVVPDPGAKEIHILVEYSHTGVRDSYTTELDGMPGASGIPSEGGIPNAFLIVNGLSTYPLTRPVVNIGCDPTNQLVLEAPRVSRMHAQLRFINDYFVIFDLDSKEGTIVNGVAVVSHVLHPGDVIMLAGVPLVYGQETPSQLGYTQELPAEPPAPEVL